MAKEKNMNQDAANDEEMTVTLTLDDGTDLECVVLTIFEAADKEYITLLPLDGNEAEDGGSTYTAIQRTQMATRISRISRATRSTRSLRTPSTSSLIQRSTMRS